MSSKGVIYIAVTPPLKQRSLATSKKTLGENKGKTRAPIYTYNTKLVYNKCLWNKRINDSSTKARG